ncbi:uncharacterized protein LOC117092395 isoform X1 [Trachypithecus francoisi]|uniref:uncharacterized protein LOC117092395 isoform X1 n=1 Tax=Trachypithecus francoisi TaxID=54180 RepID=UPI00141B46D3|nr:uncharacterized protein LOC117092395 isoform X1 [Trachypithecus francoisi]
MRIAARGEGLDRFLLGGRIEKRACPHPSPSPAVSPAVTLRAAGGVWGSWTGEGNACPWAERRGDSGGRGRGRMQALRVSRALIRSFSSTARNRFQNRVPEKQKLFQVGGAGLGVRGSDAPAGAHRAGGRRGALKGAAGTLLIRHPHIQEDNDIPLYLKGGIVDNILYRVTMGLCLGGSAYSMYCLGWASFPRN